MTAVGDHRAIMIPFALQYRVGALEKTTLPNPVERQDMTIKGDETERQQPRDEQRPA